MSYSACRDKEDDHLRNPPEKHPISAYRCFPKPAWSFWRGETFLQSQLERQFVNFEILRKSISKFFESSPTDSTFFNFCCNNRLNLCCYLILSFMAHNAQNLRLTMIPIFSHTPKISQEVGSVDGFLSRSGNKK